MLQNGPNPLPQNITIASTGGVFDVTAVASTSTGGSWLTVSPTVLVGTPRTLEVSVTAPVTMPAGIYTGEVVLYSNTTSMTVPVTFTVASAANPYFDNLPGEMTFSMQTPTGGSPQPPSNQVFQIRNAGSGTLNWTLTPLTFDGGNWLTVSVPSGTAPEIVTVGITPGNLPNNGLVAGVFVGQLLVQSGQMSITIPVSVTIGANVFGQINGIDFTMQQAGAQPLPQVLTVTSTGAVIDFTPVASTSTGGNWLTISPTVLLGTPHTLIVTVNAAPTLAPGIYTGQISFYSNTVSQTVPVTLTVAAANTPFFDNVPGALSYSLALPVGGQTVNPPSQNVQIRNRGTGTLGWTAQVSTSDGGNWLTVSATSGTAPSLVSVGIVTQNLQNKGLVAGLFTGQILFLAGNNSSVTVPVSVHVTDPSGSQGGFAQINGINFTMPHVGANPLPQILTTTTIGPLLDFTPSAATGNGGTWMTISPTVLLGTPYVVTVTVSAPPGLAAGTYTGEVIMDAATSATVVPVTLTVAPPTVPFFDNVQGQMSFFAATSATPVSQTMLIEDAGAFGLGWTLTPVTADSGNWLVPSVLSGTAPSNITVGINIQNLPNQGLVAGQFTGQLLFQSSNSTVTVPVSVQLGPNIFNQLAGLNFSMPYGGSNPLAQPPTVSSSGTVIDFTPGYASGNGGNWLSISPTVLVGTPRVITFSVNGAPGGVPVPAGIHTGQAVFNSARSAMTVPVTLTVSGTPVLSIAKNHTGNFSAGQTNATYTVTVSNQTGASVGPTNGTATVTETVPTGMSLVSMAGTNWTCPPGGNTCTRSDSLNPGQSYDPITVTVNVAAGLSTVLSNQVSVSGAGSVIANASDPTIILTNIDLNPDGSTVVADIQVLINEALGVTQAVHDLNHDGVVNLLDLQIVVNAALNLGCVAM